MIIVPFVFIDFRQWSVAEAQYEAGTELMELTES
jgi:hypothetical protein